MSIRASFIAISDPNFVRELPVTDDFYSHQFIQKKYQVFDLELFTTKWWDYRHLTSFQATCLYIEAFGKVSRVIYAREFDITRADAIGVLSAEALLDNLKCASTKAKATFTACWRGRQVADAMGMRYADYIELAMSSRLRHWKRGDLPKAGHLYDERDVEIVAARWVEMQANQNYFAEDPAYLVQNYQGTRAQNDYHEYLFSLCERRVERAVGYADFIKNDRLPLDKVHARLSEADFAQVQLYLT